MKMIKVDKVKKAYNILGLVVRQIGLDNNLKTFGTVDRVYRGSTESPISLMQALRNINEYTHYKEKYIPVLKEATDILLKTDREAERYFNGINRKEDIEYIDFENQLAFDTGIMGHKLEITPEEV